MRCNMCHGFRTNHSVKKSNPNNPNDVHKDYNYHINRKSHVALYCDECGHNKCGFDILTTVKRPLKPKRQKSLNMYYQEEINDGIAIAYHYRLH